MDMRKAIPGDYLKAVDCEPPVKMYIQEVTEEAIGLEKEIRHVLSFRDEDKKLVLNKTNIEILIEALGNESKDWFGSKCELFSADTTYHGKPCKGIRVRNCVKSPTMSEAQAAQETLPQDDIPF